MRNVIGWMRLLQPPPSSAVEESEIMLLCSRKNCKSQGSSKLVQSRKIVVQEAFSHQASCNPPKVSCDPCFSPNLGLGSAVLRFQDREGPWYWGLLWHHAAHCLPAGVLCILVPRLVDMTPPATVNLRWRAKYEAVLTTFASKLEMHS